MEKVKVESVKAWETTGTDFVPEEVRVSVLESVLAGLRAAQLSQAELLSLVGAIHVDLAKGMGSEETVVVTATGVAPGIAKARASSSTVAVECAAPFLVAATVELMVRSASPELWQEIRWALTASDAELARAARGQDAPAS